jgi:hypothetical protein
MINTWAPLIFVLCASIYVVEGFCMQNIGRALRSVVMSIRTPQLSSLFARKTDNYDMIDRSIFDDDDRDDDSPERQPSPRQTDKKSSKEPKQKISIFSGLNRWENVNRALLAGVFVAGIGAGITVDSAINTNPKDLASRDAIDRNAPNPKLCTTFGSSAMVLDQRIFVTFNPFNVYVTQGIAYSQPKLPMLFLKVQCF